MDDGIASTPFTKTRPLGKELVTEGFVKSGLAPPIKSWYTTDKSVGGALKIPKMKGDKTKKGAKKAAGTAVVAKTAEEEQKATVLKRVKENLRKVTEQEMSDQELNSVTGGINALPQGEAGVQMACAAALSGENLGSVGAGGLLKARRTRRPPMPQHNIK